MKYRYSGPTSGVTLIIDGQPREVMLFDQRDVELPETHEYTLALIAQQRLTPAPKAPIAKTEPKKDTP
ncbi:hypothetical protein [Lysobacter sp. CA196]|uniref:hypothetical protein n=1 Tax=Lysobacter sp. CA196 TaxID=3455606 RepID=UPI003F8D6E6B